MLPPAHRSRLAGRGQIAAAPSRDVEAQLADMSGTSSDRVRPAARRGPLHGLQTGRLADATLAGALLALVLTGLLGGVKLDVLGALGTLCVMLVLLVLAGFDLVVRWTAMDLPLTSAVEFTTLTLKWTSFCCLGAILWT